MFEINVKDSDALKINVKDSDVNWKSTEMSQEKKLKNKQFFRTLF